MVIFQSGGLRQEDVKSLLSVIENPKYLAIASTLYSSGLRLSECLNLKIEDLDSSNMVITVRNGKGRISFMKLASRPE